METCSLKLKKCEGVKYYGSFNIQYCSAECIDYFEDLKECPYEARMKIAIKDVLIRYKITDFSVSYPTEHHTVLVLVYNKIESKETEIKIKNSIEKIKTVSYVLDLKFKG